MKFAIKDFFGGCRQIRRKLRIWSHLLGKSLMEDFICLQYVPNSRAWHARASSFTCPKCKKKFLQKDNMLQHVKKHSLKYANFIARCPGYIYELLYCYIFLNFNFLFVKYFLLLNIDRCAFFANRTFMSTISFMLCFLFKLIERSGRLLVPTLLCRCRLPI